MGSCGARWCAGEHLRKEDMVEPGGGEPDYKKSIQISDLEDAWMSIVYHEFAPSGKRIRPGTRSALPPR